MDVDYRNHNPVPNEGIYEQEVCYNPENYEPVTIQNKAVKADSGEIKDGKKLSQKFWKIFTCLVLLLVFVVATVGIYYIAKNNASKSGESGSSSKLTTTSTSCLDLKNSGVSSDGYHFIQPNGTDTSIKVYCDMTTSGGGWTLVASVHENDINGKCTTADMWFSNDLARYSIFSRNWENRNIFGNVKEATSADYKNIGYSVIKASNVMLRHVPNKTPVDKSKSLASLQYHTSNNFLNKYGGNLFATYTKHYPMNPKTTSVTYPPDINKLVDAIAALSTNITSGIPDFYKYTYGTETDRLRDGGQNMFTLFGMQLYFYFFCGHYVVHGNEFKCSSSRSVTVSRKSHPFIVVTTIGNLVSSSNLYYQVHAYRPRSDPVTSYNGKLTEGNFELQYRARCVYGRIVPSLCDVVFAVNNTKDWASSTTFTWSESTSHQYNHYYYYVYMNTYPRRIMFCYTMLSRTGGRLVTKVQVESTLRKMLQPFKTYTWSAEPCASNHLVVPVTYTIGESTLSNFVPPFMKLATTTGFLQIRAESHTGTYYAMCPAVKLNNCDGQYVCIGGVKNGYSQTNDCNDLTDWNGLTYNPDYHASKNFAHSSKDIESTIMIFYR
uniref:uncharacterized protein LOC100185179 isoform X2 n=1 Tax=Ciona intestinalis TaxID=7719 RepID=UPI00089DB59F|nr:uncharacterized protein LOC100185179 isoform X2 [Ciona intestinalis]XP_026690545.1 uncharacterized protein LOC100185179 isoform X2 [Ciona intestinalis]XP_026690546.1 uncharacterized protein LOC100185179 isoform X2 [Ciona intestinalis]XP_026690547.1 uncharacterized protein LOC100185179 isoform X2 [Ciona intestinalis]|eukprot:XP_026690544.1 uncharacterized protein LOC100185179 isoform X2 [Ciona intestinalis]